MRGHSPEGRADRYEKDHRRARGQVRQQPRDHLRERPDPDPQLRPPDHDLALARRRRRHQQPTPHQGQAPDARLLWKDADRGLWQPQDHQQAPGQGAGQGRQEDPLRPPHGHQARRDRCDLPGPGRQSGQGRKAVARHRRVDEEARKYRRSRGEGSPTPPECLIFLIKNIEY